jgi:hypothetical protein
VSGNQAKRKLRILRWSVPITAASVATAVLGVGVATAGVVVVAGGGTGSNVAQLAPDQPNAPGPAPVFDSPIPLPAQALASKQAMQAAQPHDTVMPSASVTYSWLPARPDDGGHGGGSTVAAVKAAAVADLNQDVNGMALTCGTSCTSEPPLTEQQLTDHLHPSLAVWASSVRAAKQTEEVNAVLQMQGDPTYVPYSAFRWDVSRWGGVTVRGDTAAAVFEGRGDYLTAGKWHQDDLLQQVQLKLALEDGAWRLLDEEIISQ